MGVETRLRVPRYEIGHKRITVKNGRIQGWWELRWETNEWPLKKPYGSNAYVYIGHVVYAPFCAHFTPSRVDCGTLCYAQAGNREIGLDRAYIALV